MANHVSATVRETPHVTKPTRTNTIINALKRRAQAVLNDKSIDPQSRAIIRYGLETNDPWLAELVRRAEAGETILSGIASSDILDADEDGSSEEKIEALAEIICRAGDKAAAALLVLMARIEDAAHPKALANTAKHLAFTRCGELNFCDMVDAQIPLVESQLLLG